jgi:hypothetical protein
MLNRVLPLIVFVLSVTGCASLQFPAYIQDKHPYTQRFYADHDEVLAAVKKNLGELGWQIEGTADPLTYEQNRIPEAGSQDVLLFTEVRQTPKILWTSYVRLNVFVQTKNKVSDVEIRYSKINSFPFKQFKKFRNDRLVKRIFQRITDSLNQSK